MFFRAGFNFREGAPLQWEGFAFLSQLLKYMFPRTGKIHHGCNFLGAENARLQKKSPRKIGILGLRLQHSLAEVPQLVRLDHEA